MQAEAADGTRARVASLTRGKALYAILLVVGFVAHFSFSLPLFDWVDRSLAVMLLATALYSVHRFFNAPIRSAPLVPLVFVQLYVMYGAAQFTQSSMRLMGGYYVPSSDAITLALIVVLAAEAAFFIAHRIALTTVPSVKKALFLSYRQPTAGWSRAAAAIAMISLAIQLLQRFVPKAIPDDLRNVIAMVLNPYLMLSILMVLGYRYNLRLHRRLAIVMVATMSVIGLASGMVEGVVVPLYALAAGSWLWGKKISLRWVVIAATIFLVLSPIKARYRQLAWKGSADQSVASSLTQWGEALERTINDPFGAERGAEATASRVSALIPLAQVVEWVPAFVPYKEGEGFWPTLLFIVPRALWPDKPSISDLVNNRYATEFRITTAQGTKHSTFGIYQPADGYWDFGIAGAAGYSAALGFLIGFLFSPQEERTVTAQMLGLIFSCLFFQSLSSLFNEIASLFTLLLGAWILMRVMSILSSKALPTPEDMEAPVESIAA